MKKPLLRVAMAVLPLLLSAPSANAQGPLWCEGIVRTVLVDKEGTLLLMASYRNDWTQICNITTTWKSVPAAVCNVWVAHLTTAVATQQNIIVAYGSLSSCGALPTYGDSPGPNYVSLQKP